MKKLIFVLVFNFSFLNFALAGSKSCLERYSKIEEQGLITIINISLKENPESNKALIISNVMQEYMEKLTTPFLRLNSTLSSIGTNNQVQMSINTSSKTLDSFYTLVTQITESYKKQDSRYQQLLKEFLACKNNLSVCKSSLVVSQAELKKSYADVELLLILLDKAQEQFAIAKEFFSGPVREDHKSQARFGIETISDSEVYALVRNSIDQKLQTLQTYSDVIKKSYEVLKKQEHQIITLLGFSIPDAEMQALSLQAQQNIPIEAKEMVAKKSVMLNSNSKYDGVAQELIERLAKLKQTVIGERVVEKIEKGEVTSFNLFETMETERRRRLVELEHAETDSVAMLNKLDFYTLKDLEVIFSVLIDKVASERNSWPYRLVFKSQEVRSIKFGNISFDSFAFFSGLFLLSKDMDVNLYKNFIVLYNKLIENKIAELNSQIAEEVKPSWWLPNFTKKGKSRNAELNNVKHANWVLNNKIEILKSLKMEPSSHFVSLLLEVLETKERSVSLLDSNGKKIGELPLSVTYGKANESN
ncbi:MAG: hypothetical protein L6Q37_05110 [Bdellovibrionaceae bacterium]|nr:hypothetical protein [Pseudobdellovibrionaceae bacterium]NUM57296.1 hypothetical protein [Pseudobdellovibrionaceae bacterium]